MIVTKIEGLGRGRYRIFIDGQLAFVLYRGELKTYGISENKEISPENYDLIKSEVLVKRARLRAMNLLTKRSYTVSQLKNKLSDGDYPEEIINDALDYVASFGYVDDRKYAEDYIDYHRDDKSLARIRQDLSAKGIDRDIISDVIDEIMESDDPVDEEAQIRKLLEKRHFDIEEASYEDIQKQCAFLARKGFSGQTIRQCMK